MPVLKERRSFKTSITKRTFLKPCKATFFKWKPIYSAAYFIVFYLNYYCIAMPHIVHDHQES